MNLEILLLQKEKNMKGIVTSQTKRTRKKRRRKRGRESFVVSRRNATTSRSSYSSQDVGMFGHEVTSYPNKPPTRAPARRLIANRLSAATTIRMKPSAAASFCEPAM